MDDWIVDGLTERQQRIMAFVARGAHVDEIDVATGCGLAYYVAVSEVHYLIRIGVLRWEPDTLLPRRLVMETVDGRR